MEFVIYFGSAFFYHDKVCRNDISRNDKVVLSGVFSFSFFLFHFKTMGLNVVILPVVTKDLPSFPRFTPNEFLSRCKFSSLTTHQLMVEFYLTHVLPLSSTEEIIELTTSALLAGVQVTYYLVDHSGDEVHAGNDAEGLKKRYSKSHVCMEA